METTVSDTPHQNIDESHRYDDKIHSLFILQYSFKIVKNSV